MTKREELLERIRKHGEQLLAIFPQATERDPVKLCKKLRQIEAAGIAIGVRLCNGPNMSEQEQDNKTSAVMARLGELLQFQAAGVPVFLNLDPRGYALKIEDEWMRANMRDGERGHAIAKLHHDWGGYGIIAPDLTEGE